MGFLSQKKLYLFGGNERVRVCVCVKWQCAGTDDVARNHFWIFAGVIAPAVHSYITIRTPFHIQAQISAESSFSGALRPSIYMTIEDFYSFSWSSLRIHQAARRHSAEKAFEDLWKGFSRRLRAPRGFEAWNKSSTEHCCMRALIKTQWTENYW